MKAKFTKKLAVICLSAVMSLGIGVGVAGIKPANATQLTYKNVADINENYLLNTSVSFSDSVVNGKTTFPKTITVDSDTATADSVTYPNGVVRKVGDYDLSLNTLGKYSVLYKGQSGDYFDTFVVLNNFADILSDGYLEKKIKVDGIEQYYAQNTSIVFSNDVVSGATVLPKTIEVNGNEYVYNRTLFPNQNIVTSETFSLGCLGRYVVYYVNADSSDYYTCGFTSVADTKNGGNSKEEFAGVRAVMTPGTTINFNKVIDLNNVDEKGNVELFTFKYNVGYEGVELFTDYLYIKIEDVNDPNTYIMLNLENFNNASNKNNLYFRASTKDLPDVACKVQESPINSTGESNANTSKNKRLLTFRNGKPYTCFHSYGGVYSRGPHANNVISFNPSTMELYLREESSSTKYFIVDFNDVNTYDAGAKLFEGFPSNNVKISLSSGGQLSNYYVEFSQIGDSKGEELHSLLAGVSDTKAPDIKLDCEETTSGSVYALYGSDFVLPSARAIDANSPSNVSVKVYKNYSSTKELVSLNEDGTLKISNSTVYTAEYSSFDLYGNESKVLLNIVPVQRTKFEEVSGKLSVNDGIRFEADKISLVTGQTVSGKIVNTIESLNNFNKLKLNVAVRFAGETIYSEDYNYLNVESAHFNFTPVAEGDYTVIYTYEDNVTKNVVTYNVSCSSNNLVGFNGAPQLYNYYIYGLEYDLSRFNAYKFGTTVEEQATSVEVSYDGGEFVSISKNYVIGADSEGNVPLDKNVYSVQFKFKSGNAEYVTPAKPIVDIRKDTTKSLEVKGVNGNIDYSKYFDTTDFDVSKVGTSYLFDAINPVGSAELKIISPLTFNRDGDIVVAFSTYNTHKDFNKISVKLTDAYNPDNYLKFNYEYYLNNTLVYVDGGRKYPTNTVPLFSKDENVPESELDFSFNVNNQIITASNRTFNVNFRPTANMFYVSLELGDIYGQSAGISVTTVSNVEINNSTIIDTKAPIAYYESSAGNYAIGSLVTIYAQSVADFATPFISKNSSVKVTLNNQPVMSEEGVLLNGVDNDPTKNYTIKVKDFVTYKIDYKATDAAGKNAGSTYRITGVDKVKPVITLNHGFNENTIHNVTLGKPFTIDYTVSDDKTVTQAIKSRVIIIHDRTMRPTYSTLPMECSADEGEYTLITDTCTLTTKGMYTVYVYAYDEAGNTTYAKYKLNVR